MSPTDYQFQTPDSKKGHNVSQDKSTASNNSDKKLVYVFHEVSAPHERDVIPVLIDTLNERRQLDLNMCISEMEGNNFYFAISYKFLKCVKWDFLSDPPKTSFLVYYKFH